MEKPVEVDYKLLKKEYDESCGLVEIDILNGLLQICLSKINAIIKDMRSFVQKNYDAHQVLIILYINCFQLHDKIVVQSKNLDMTKDDIRNIAMKEGRRPQEASLTLGLSIKESLETQSEGDNVKSELDSEYVYKLKFCLYLESLLASVEIGLPL